MHRHYEVGCNTNYMAMLAVTYRMIDGVLESAIVEQDRKSDWLQSKNRTYESQQRMAGSVEQISS